MKRDNFVEMQWFALDFDNGEVTFENILQIANDYGIAISFAYETFSSTQENQRFRVVFQHEFSIPTKKFPIFIGNFLIFIM